MLLDLVPQSHRPNRPPPRYPRRPLHPHPHDQKAGSQRCERLKALEAEAPAIREACARFISEHRAQIEQAEPAVPTELSDRAAEIWEPLLVLADIAGGDWPRLAREAAIALSAKTSRPDPVASLLMDIQIVFAACNETQFHSRALVDHLQQMQDRPWQELLNGSQLDDRWLAWKLRPLGIKPRNIRQDGRVLKGYHVDDLAKTPRSRST